MRCRRSLIAALAAAGALHAAAAPLGRSNDLLRAHADDVSFSLVNLSLTCSNFSLWERMPAERLAFAFDHASVSISLLRFFVHWRWYVDTFSVSGVHASFFQLTNGAYRLFQQDVPASALSEVLTGSTASPARHSAGKKADGAAFFIPLVRFEDVNVECYDHRTTNWLWSFDNTSFAVRDFAAPVGKNKNPWRIELAMGLNHDTNCFVACTATLRTIERDPFIHLRLAITNLSLATAGVIIGTNEQAMAEATGDDAHHSSWFERCFSQECNRLYQAFDRVSSMPATANAYSNFLAGASHSNIFVTAGVDLAISNRAYLPGRIAFTLHRPRDGRSLSLNYAITNTPDVLVPLYLAQ